MGCSLTTERPRRQAGWPVSWLARSALTTALVLLAMVSARPLCAADFRGVEWGASRADVRATEKHDLHHDTEDELAYWGFQLGGVEAGLVYEFEDHRLRLARFVSRSPSSEPSAHLADYRSWQKLNREHFDDAGEQLWLDARDRPVAPPEDALAALINGSAKLVTRWQRETARVTLLIAGGDGEIKTVRSIFEPP